MSLFFSFTIPVQHSGFWGSVSSVGAILFWWFLLGMRGSNIKGRSEPSTHYAAYLKQFNT